MEIYVDAKGICLRSFELHFDNWSSRNVVAAALVF